MQEAPLVEKKEKIMPSSESYTYITNLQGKMCLLTKRKQNNCSGESQVQLSDQIWGPLHKRTFIPSNVSLNKQQQNKQ